MQRLSPWVTRVLLCTAIFVFESGLSGAWLISTQWLLYPFGFFIYGSAGKVLLFGVLLLAILVRDRIGSLQLSPWRRYQTLGLLASLSLLLPFFVSARMILVTGALPWVILAHASLILMVAIAGIACFPLPVCLNFWRAFRRQILVAGAISIGFWILMERVYTLWPYLSHAVLNAVVWMLRLTHGQVLVIPPLTIALPEFSITVGQYCSGIESILLISTLYVVIGCMDYPKLSLGRYLLFYGLLISGLLLVNVIRVYAIIQAGLWLSPQLAAQLFHTYLGMLLFLAYFLFMMSTIYPKLHERFA